MSALACTTALHYGGHGSGSVLGMLPWKRAAVIMPQAAYFEQKFYATFLLDPVEAASAATKPPDKHLSAAKSPRHSPRGETELKKPPAAQQHPQKNISVNSSASHSHNVSTREETGQASTSSTPDLSPRTMGEADDPPTPRMYKAIVPVASRADHGQHGLGAVKAEVSQIVLHQGHFGHNSQQFSPKRSVQHQQSAQEQELQRLHSNIRCTVFS